MSIILIPVLIFILLPNILIEIELVSAYVLVTSLDVTDHPLMFTKLYQSIFKSNLIRMLILRLHKVKPRPMWKSTLDTKEKQIGIYFDPQSQSVETYFRNYY